MRHKVLIVGGALAILIVSLGVLARSLHSPRSGQDTSAQLEEQHARAAIISALAAGHSDPGTVEERQQIFASLEESQ